MTAQSHQLFNDLYYAPIDTSTQVERFPPADAPCLCGHDDTCLFPFVFRPRRAISDLPRL